jgi:2-enoate reductase
MKASILFERARIGSCELKNRFAMAPLGPLGLSDSEGGWNERGIAYYAARAAGGTGLIHTGITFVESEIEPRAVGNCPNSTRNPTHFIRTSSELTERVHAHGAKIFLQMTAGMGRVTVPKAAGFFPPVAPSPIQHRWLDVTCREMSIEEIHTLVQKFGEGAYYARAAGFDGIQIHAVHEGYLLDQFAVALFNRREDEYGGSLENRLRIVKEIREAIAERCGEDFPVSMRFSPKSFIKAPRLGALPGEEFVEAGRDMPEGLETAKLLEKYGYAALDVDVGSYDAWWWSHPPMYQKKGLYIPYCKAVREVVSIPVICAGRMDDPVLAAKAVEDGACDIVSLGRPLMADSHIVVKIQTGRESSIRPCLSCQEGCMGRIGKSSSLRCAVNPECCRESDAALTLALLPKKVLIIGGGPAGCEAARVLKLRGHEPVLYEAGIRLGGNLLAGGAPDFKEDDLALAKWYSQELAALGVTVKLGQTATAETPAVEDADIVIIATGGLPRKPLTGETICTAAQALLGEKPVGERAVVYGGATVACETALWLRSQGKAVTIVYRGESILSRSGPLCHANRDMLKALIGFKGIDIVTGAVVTGASSGSVTMRDKNGEHDMPADTLVLAVGYEPNRALADELAPSGRDIRVIGDANRISNIQYAIWDAFEVARTL